MRPLAEICNNRKSLESISLLNPAELNSGVNSNFPELVAEINIFEKSEIGIT